jgi:hypothetical protein
MGCLILDSQVCRKHESIEDSLVPHTLYSRVIFCQSKRGRRKSERDIGYIVNVMSLAGKGSKRDLCTCHEGKDKKSLADHHMRFEYIIHGTKIRKADFERGKWIREEIDEIQKKAERELMSIFCFTECMHALCHMLPKPKLPYMYILSVKQKREGKKASSHAKHFIRRSVCRKS